MKETAIRPSGVCFFCGGQATNLCRCIPTCRLSECGMCRILRLARNGGDERARAALVRRSRWPDSGSPADHREDA